MRKEKLLPVMFFFSLVSGDAANWSNFWQPAALMEWFMWRLPIKVNLFEILCIGMLVTTRRKPSTVAKPMIQALHASLATTAFCVLYGYARGGLLKPMYTQAHFLVFGPLFALTCASVLATPEDFRRMGRAIVYAALWQALVVMGVYLKFRGGELPGYMTTHEDSVTFTIGFLILISEAVELRTRKAIRSAVLAAPLIVMAIVFNNRRLAWASLLAGIFLVYAMLPSRSRVNRKINRALTILGPVLAIYVALGWGRTEPIFKPVGAISSMISAKASGQLDRSTQARDNENLGMVTMMPSAPLLGTGLGHKWLDIDSTYAVPEDVFPMYHYSPHNSVLAFLAFCGGIGLAGVWMMLPVSVFLNARTYRRSEDPIERSVAVVGIAMVIAYLNQCYGDMGIAWMTPICVAAVGMAAAARLSVRSGAFPASGAARNKQPSPDPVRA
ncbi:MAG TPA: O-antigen ligase family protein [Polyangiaceae bacterium]|nr:O-antigen ligase family protein [Polyangiaceae bacterium]